jgi:putative colanic acid biosynthesis acetyltransferase WcaF
MSRLAPLPPPDLTLRLERMLFGLCWMLLCRWTPRPLHGWRCAVLRAFGARIDAGAHVYPDCTIWLPRRLSMATNSCLGPGVECYCVAQVTLERDALVSQGAYLCTASHAIHSPGFELVGAPITLEAGVWVAARAVVLPGVVLRARSVLGAAAVLTRDTEAEGLYGGNPARRVGTRRTDQGLLP